MKAVKDVSFAVQENTICGLLGRNGAGKTTLMRLITGQEFASAGQIRVFGENPVENAAVLSRTCFVRETQVYPDSFRGRHALRRLQRLFPNWDADYAGTARERIQPAACRGASRRCRAVSGPQ